MKEIIFGLFAILVVYSCAQSKYKRENPVPLTAEQRAHKALQDAAWEADLKCTAWVKANPMPTFDNEKRIAGCIRAKLYVMEHPPVAPTAEQLAQEALVNAAWNAGSECGALVKANPMPTFDDDERISECIRVKLLPYNKEKPQ